MLLFILILLSMLDYILKMHRYVSVRYEKYRESSTNMALDYKFFKLKVERMFMLKKKTVK